MRNTCRFKRSVQHSLRNGCLLMMVALEESLTPQVDATDTASRVSLLKRDTMLKNDMLRTWELIPGGKFKRVVVCWRSLTLAGVVAPASSSARSSAG